jgi:WD40 repeat protein
VWDAKTGEQLRELQGHTDAINSVAFSPDGNQIVSGSSDQSVWVWDAKTGEQLRELQGHTMAIRSVAFSPDGNQIVSGSHDQSMQVWDAKGAMQVMELHHHIKNINFFSPDSSAISSSAHQLVHIWAKLSPDTWWIMDKDGWILSDNKQLIWIPSTIRNVLYHPYNVLIISRHGSATISFGNSKLGPVWHKCYTP